MVPRNSSKSLNVWFSSLNSHKHFALLAAQTFSHPSPSEDKHLCWLLFNPTQGSTLPSKQLCLGSKGAPKRSRDQRPRFPRSQPSAGREPCGTTGDVFTRESTKSGTRSLHCSREASVAAVTVEQGKKQARQRPRTLSAS